MSVHIAEGLRGGRTEICGEPCPGSFVLCSLDPGHAGDHRAHPVHDLDSPRIHVWPQTQKAPTQAEKDLEDEERRREVSPDKCWARSPQERHWFCSLKPKHPGNHAAHPGHNVREPAKWTWPQDGKIPGKMAYEVFTEVFHPIRTWEQEQEEEHIGWATFEEKMRQRILAELIEALTTGEQK
jgi:hypothetical protein